MIDVDNVAELLTLTVCVNEWGTRRYRNSEGQLHRTCGAAIEWASGDRCWFINGQELTEKEFHERIKRRGG